MSRGQNTQKLPLDTLILHIGTLCLAKRLRQKISIRNAAKEIGLSYSGYHRVERGQTPNGQTLKMVFRWLYKGQAMPKVAFPGGRTRQMEAVNSKKMERLLSKLTEAI